MRWVNAVVFLAAAVGVGALNATRKHEVWYLPFDAVVPSLRGDLVTQGHITVGLFALLGLFFLARALREEST